MRQAVYIMTAIVLLALAPAAASAESPDEVMLVKNKSVVIDVESPVSRVSLGSPDIASMLLLSPRQIYLAGKEFGATTLTLWTDGGIVVKDIKVVPDVTGLKRMLHEVLPAETDISVRANAESVTLTGSVSSASALKAANELAQTVAPEKVVNLLRVDGVMQVMLEVRVAEMTRTVLKRMGVNFAYLSNNFTAYSFLNGLTSLDQDGDVINLTDRINGVVQSTSGSSSFSGFIDALKANGLVKVLAEPNLVCVSGETADFLAGGEIPIPVPQALGMVSIEYKPFGVGLKFTPTVLSSGVINLQVKPEVSELDYSNAVTFQGYTIPAVQTRKASTVVELADGQSFVVGGLISDSLRENANRFPVLGDVPVLGSLFSSNDFRSNKTELVIIVTAHLVKPVDAATQSLPTDGFREPNDYEFYLLGLLEGRRDEPALTSAPENRRKSAVVSPESGFDGDLGHSLPN